MAIVMNGTIGSERKTEIDVSCFQCL